MRQLLLILISLGLLQGCTTMNDQGAEGSDYAHADASQGNTALARKENDLALNLMDDARYPDAEPHLRRALAADVLYGPAHNNLGTLYFRQGKLYLAAQEFQYAAKLMPRQPEPRNNLGLVFEASGKMSDAVSSYDKALSIDPENPEFIGNSARARFRRGDQTEELRAMLNKLVAIDTRSDWVDWARHTLRKVAPAEASAP